MRMMIEDLIWCEAYGDTHDPEEEDPFNEGPQYVEERTKWEYHGNPAWEIRNDPEYTESRLWFYTCPGPHFKLWKGAKHEAAASA